LLQTRPWAAVIAAALLGLGAQAAVAVPPLWGDAAAARTALGLAAAVAAGAFAGILPGLVVAVGGWLLNAVFVAEDALTAAVALPAWLAAGGAAGWVALRVLAGSGRLRAADERLAAVAEAASDALAGVDPDGRITTWSRGAESLFGHGADEIAGRPLADLLAGEGTEEEVGSRLERAAAAGERVTLEAVEARRRDGRVFTASVVLVPAGDGAVLSVRDVGELQRTTGRLRELEARYRSLTEHLPLVTYVTPLDPDGGVSGFVSSQVERLTGYGPEEWLADEDLRLRLIHPGDRERVVAERAAAVERGRFGSTYRLLSRGGRAVWVREEAVAVLDERGRPACLQGYLLDVSERHAAEEERAALHAQHADATAESRDRQRLSELVANAALVLASSHDARATVTKAAALVAAEAAEWCVVDVLEEDGTLLRLAAERGGPAPVGVQEPAPQPEDGVREVLRERRAELTESRVRLPLLTRGGRAVGVLTLLSGEHGRRYGPDDLPWARALAATTALALENARLHTEVEARSDANKVLTHVGDGVFLLDAAGVIRLWNPAAAAITGVPGESALGRPAAEAFPGWQEIAERIPAGTTQEPVRAEALPLDTDRGERWISISGVEFFGGTVYAFRDITEEHRLDELKAEFIATASHELRTPLAAVYGAAQTLRRHDFALDDAGRARFISLIVDESEQLARIVNQILLANQLEVGRLDLVTEPFDAGELLERVVEAARTHAPPHITFGVKAGEHVPPVAADKDRVRQILVNLVENAVKYSPGGGRIELSVEASDGAVLFHVADEGLGIPAEERPRIFEKFYRLDPDMTQGVGGTGLGLYICSELVERMGGRIWVESEEGRGSAFSFELPAAGSHRPSRSREAGAQTDLSGAPPGR
jgi:PAS domain S-box-containing protein